MYDSNHAPNFKTAGSARALMPANGLSTLSGALLLAMLALPLSATAQANRDRSIRSMEDAVERQRAPVLPGPPIIGLPPPGAGPASSIALPIKVNPTPGAGGAGLLPVVDSSKGPTGLPGPGAGESRVYVGAPPPPANAPAPVLATTPASVGAPPLASAVVPPRSETASVLAPAPAPAAAIVVTAAPTPVIASVPAALPPVTDPTRTPTQGAGSPDVVTVGQGAGPPPASYGFAPQASAPAPTAVVGASSAPVRPSAALGEILPGAQELSESRQVVLAPILSRNALVPETPVAKVSARCQTISIRPDAQRQAVSLVDFTGDKLIVAAVPDALINTVFERAGYNRLDLSKAATWCVLPSVARELLQPVQNASAQEAALVVQSGGSLQLMSRDQWLTYQASLKPVVVASVSNKTAAPLKGVNRAGSKATRQSGKATFNLLRPTAVSGKAGGLLPSS